MVTKRSFFGLMCFVDAIDYFRLSIMESKIEDLEEQLKWIVDAGERHEKRVLLQLCRGACNKIWQRIIAREVRHHEEALTH
jgi:hypothetical protein